MDAENLDDIPTIFRPLRSHHAIFPVYKNLQGRILSDDEKAWLCNEVAQNSTSPVWYDQCRSKTGLQTRYGLSSNFFFRNMKTYLNPHISFQSGGGKRKYIDNTSLSALANAMENRSNAHNDISNSVLKKMYESSYVI